MVNRNMRRNTGAFIAAAGRALVSLWLQHGPIITTCAFAANVKIAQDKAAFLNEFEKLETKMTLTQEQGEWVEVLAQGWSDLPGFMREKQYLKSLHHQDPPVPVVLACDLPIGSNPAAIGLRYDYSATTSSSGGGAGSATSGVAAHPPPVAILRNVEVYEHRKEERIARTFGLTHPSYPYVENFIAPGGPSLCGGDLEVLEENPKRGDGLDHYRKTPAEIEQVFALHDAVFVFQLRNPIHNGHALLMKDTHRQLKEKGFKNPMLWINPLGGWTKEDDVPLDTRMRQHEVLLANNVFGADLPVLLSIFPSPMLYAGPREVQWHALARQKVGATHYIVGRDPAGMKHPGTKEDAYSAWHGQTMLELNPLFTMSIVPFQFAAYDKTAGEMRFFDPARKDDFVSISGTKMRALAAKGETPPDGFMHPEGWEVLVEYYKRKAKAETERQKGEL